MTLTIYNAEDIPQGSDAWLEARRGIVTASTIGKMLTSTGKVANNDTSRALTETLVAERLSGQIDYTPPTRDMQRGTILEAFSRDIYAEHYAPVDEIGFGKLETPTYIIGASPDGLVSDDGGFETKSPRPRTHLRTILEDRVPAHYMAQVQTCLLVFNRAWWDFASYVPGMPYYVTRVFPDPRWQEAIIAAAEQFEENAVALIAKYERETYGRPKTEYHDPFAEEDIIIG